LAESAVLALTAGLIALVATTWTLPVLLQCVAAGLPRGEVVRVDVGVTAFSLGLALLVVSLAGLVPAFASAQLDVTTQLRDATRGITTPATQRRRQALVVAQVALAVTVVAAAGLLVRSLWRLQDIGVGLATDRLVYVPLDLPQRKYADRQHRRRFIADLVAQLETTPAIAAVTPINTAPFSGLGWDAPTFTAEGQSADRANTNPTLNLEEIHPTYFRAFEVALVRGRPFTADDREQTMHVAIVSADVAALAWPGEDPIGKRLKMGGPDSPDAWRTVVGVAMPTRYRDIRDLRATLYIPASQFLDAAHDLVVRTSAPLPLVADLVQSRARALDADVRVMPLRPFSALLDVPLARPRFNAVLTTLFGVTALALAAIGLYAVMAASVRLRRREIGIRIALGATAFHVQRLVLGEGARLAGLGGVLGLVLAVLTSRVLRGLLFEVQPLDPLALGTTVSLLLAVTGGALYVPVRRAIRVDPSITLRAE
jgi:predicted permease